MIKNLYVVLYLICFSLPMYGQRNEVSDLQDFKRFLPYLLKSFGDEPSIDLDQKVIGRFQKPWDVENLGKNEAKEVLAKLVENRKFKVEKDYTGEWKLSFHSKLKDFGTIEEILENKRKFSNIYIELSKIEILDTNGKSIYNPNEEKVIKYNESKSLKFNNGQIQTSFPITGEQTLVKGSIQMAVSEYMKIHYKEFNKSAIEVYFDLGEHKGLKLISITNNKAYFVLPKVIEDIEIESTNMSNEKFTKNSKSILPKKVYDFGIKQDNSDEVINDFVEKLTFDDVFNDEQVLIYETNGHIESLYILLKSKSKEIESLKLNIEL